MCQRTNKGQTKKEGSSGPETFTPTHGPLETVVRSGQAPHAYVAQLATATRATRLSFLVTFDTHLDVGPPRPLFCRVPHPPVRPLPSR